MLVAILWKVNDILMSLLVALMPEADSGSSTNCESISPTALKNRITVRNSPSKRMASRLRPS
jgi:hypothetical protein